MIDQRCHIRLSDAGGLGVGPTCDSVQHRPDIILSLVLY